MTRTVRPLAVKIVDSEGEDVEFGGGPDREISGLPFRVTNAFAGAAVGDLLLAIRVFNLSTGSPVPEGGTVWLNETQQTTLGAAPAAANIEPAGLSGLTSAQLAALNLKVRDGGKADAAVIGAVTLNSATAAAGFNTEGYSSVLFQITANASANNIIIEGSTDSTDGANGTWATIAFRLANSAAQAAGLSGATGTTATAGVILPNAVLPWMRWRISPFVAGTTTVVVGLKRTTSPNVLDVNVGNTVLAVNAYSGVYYNETTTPLGAGLQFTGLSRDTGWAAQGLAQTRAYFNAFVYADQAGTARLEVSNDNTTWRRATADVAVTATGPVALSLPVMTRYHRVVVVNGATLQGALMVNTSYSGA